MEIEIRQITFKEVKSYLRKAQKDQIGFMELPDATDHFWLGAYCAGKMAGVCCLLVQGSQARHLGTWVLPKYRRRGIFRMFMVERERLAREKGAKRIFAYCWPHTWDFLRGIGYQEIDNRNGQRHISKSLKEMERGT